jgi:HK97 family phage prohead protease
MTEYHPRDDLIRMVDLPAANVEFRDTPDGPTLGTLHGYMAVFNQWTEIDSWEGKFKERIAPGAFKKTLSEFGDRVKILFNHGFDPSIGDKPLGKPRTLKEDDKGLYVEVPLDDTSYNRDLVASVRSGALDGMSFRFSVSRETWDKEDSSLPERTIGEVARLYEGGPVTFPAYEATTAGVRARDAYQAWRTAHPTDKTSIMVVESEAGTSTSELHSGTPPEMAPVEDNWISDLRDDVLSRMEKIQRSDKETTYGNRRAGTQTRH